MNKKGFTLVELMVSIALLSIVLIFMMNTLVKLRDTSTAEGVQTNLMTGQAIISSTINSDIIKNGGILSSIEYSSNLQNIILEYNTTNVYRKIEIVPSKQALKYIDCSDISCSTTKEVLLNKSLPTGYQFLGMESNTLTDTTGASLKKIIIKVGNNDGQELSKYNIEILDYQSS